MENGAFSGINDFVISFEHLCYFSKLVKRVSKLFIPKAWIDHIAWGHGNTLVGGILVCINLHTFSWPNIDPKWLFELTNAKKTRVFMFVMCRYGYYGKQAKTRKNEHESMKGSKADAGKHFSSVDKYLSSICQSQPWRISKWQELALGLLSHKLAEVVL